MTTTVTTNDPIFATICVSKELFISTLGFIASQDQKYDALLSALEALSPNNYIDYYPNFEYNSHFLNILQFGLSDFQQDILSFAIIDCNNCASFSSDALFRYCPSIVDSDKTYSAIVDLAANTSLCPDSFSFLYEVVNLLGFFDAIGEF